MLVPAIVHGGALLVGPPDEGTSGQVLRSTGDGALAWADPASGSGANFNLDGGAADTSYGGTTNIDGGDA